MIMLVDATGHQWFGIAWGNGHFAIRANEVAIDDATIPYDYPAVSGDVIQLEIEDGLFVLKQNDVVKAIPQGEAPAPDDVDLFGQIMLWHTTASVSASHLKGQEATASTTTTAMIPRFEAHPAFNGPVDIATALDYVDTLSCSDTQEAGRWIVFQTPVSHAVSEHSFDDEVNVVAGSLRLRTTDIRNRPNRLWAEFRNLDRRYLNKDSAFSLRDELFDKVGVPIDPGPISLGPVRGSQAQRTIECLMRRRSDAKLWCELTGMDDSWKLVPGDRVTVITRKLNRVPKDFKVITATRESPERLPSGLQRTFVLQEWLANDGYSDDDHDVPQPALGTPLPSEFSGPPAPVLQLTQEVAP